MSPRPALLALLIASAASASSSEPVTAPCAVSSGLGATPFAAWTQPDDDAEALRIDHPISIEVENSAASHPLHIAEAGRYGVAADGKVWIDVVANDASLKSVGHSHGTACSGIRKIVWFTLTAGTYDLVLSKAETARVRLLVVRGP